MTCETIEIPDLKQALERGLRLQASKDPWGDQFLHCSDLGAALEDGCLRQPWYRLHGAPRNDDDLGKLWRFARGNQVHESLTPLLDTGLLGSGWEVAEVELALGPELLELFGIEKGSMDLGLRTKGLLDGRGCAMTVDYKTIKTAGLARLSAPKEDNILQVRGYMEAWQRALDIEASVDGGEPCQVIGGILLYADREGQGGFKAFFVRRDRAAVEAAAARLRELRGMEQPPPGPAPHGKKQHWRCEYRTRDGEVVKCSYLEISCPGSLALAAGEGPSMDLEEALKASLTKGGEGASL